MHRQARIDRGHAYLKTGQQEMAVGDYSRALKLKPDSELFLVLSNLYLGLGETSTALLNIKECLRSDPDDPDCKKQFKVLKRLERNLASVREQAKKNKWRSVISSLFTPDELLKQVEGYGALVLRTELYSLACTAYSRLKKDVDAINWCSKALELDPNNFEALVSRADAYTNKADYQEALEDYQKAYELNRQDPRVQEGYQKAQRLKKQAGMRDYYKTLGVDRGATTREIKKVILLTRHTANWRKSGTPTSTRAIWTRLL
jgi:DnaJ family protein C protein 3